MLCFWSRCEAVEDPAFSLKVSRDWKAGHGRIIQWENSMDFNGISLEFQWILMGYELVISLEFNGIQRGD